MTKDFLLEHIKELEKLVTVSADNYNRLKVNLDNSMNAHNVLIGRLTEATELYREMEKPDKPVVAPVMPGVLPLPSEKVK
jgi:hypothetical protein